LDLLLSIWPLSDAVNKCISWKLAQKTSMERLKLGDPSYISSIREHNRNCTSNVDWESFEGKVCLLYLDVSCLIDRKDLR
jgi:hypothetical protein